MRRLFALGAVLCVAVVAAGCGSDETSATPSTTEWADGVCSALTTWKDAIAGVPDTLKNDPSKSGLDQAAGDVKDATDALASDLKGLGRPDTEAGQSAQDTISTLADELSTGADAIETAVGDASGVSGVVQAASAIGTTLTTMGSQLSSAFSDLEALDGGEELKDSFEQAESCTALQGGS
jgi:hypothetical protein